MSAQHKAALAQGRKESRAIKAYLEALESRRPGRPITSESIQAKIETLDQKIAVEKDPLARLELRQQRLDAEDALKGVEGQADFADVEAEFIKHAGSYSQRKGISYTAWRDSGVPAAVLREAGVARTRRTQS